MSEKAKRTRASGRTSKAPSIYDVAREAKVSVFTVSAVINKTGRVSATLSRRVEAAILKLNYRPNLLARSLAKQQTHTLGMVVSDIANPFFPAIVRGAEDAAQKAGYSVLLCNSDDKEDKEAVYLELLLSKRVDGIILNKTPSELSIAQRRMLDEAKVPIVLLMRTCSGLKTDVVQTDDRRGAMDAVSHLARIGHKRIGFVSGPLHVSNARARRQGYRKALEAAGLEYLPDLSFEGDYRIESGHRAGLAVLPHRPDAVLVTNYLMTVGFMSAADEIGMRCPEDFALVSFDDYPWLGCFRPRLTTIELPKYELGENAVRLLLGRIQGEHTQPVTINLQPQLRVRESCGFMLRGRKEPATVTEIQPA
ncbi:MAG TPA: LacI family DNA-binding transcriptional regulator [Terriglobales bacterium]|nr:LacI family DNA-binding transcriptional regulator [Terriglobales bacterium]